ncbi:kinesin-like protein KIF20A isoform X1 [Alosa sapidissima]|uniref:kinesin-like protein KIF20A isoform X1 n=1 Tax=Alosa sapidissima TaxID=34773 RepID=UPI001C087A00|nr:kinesin-like protein KIF20A isoform X1 [Alosa sapidissima]
MTSTLLSPCGLLSDEDECGAVLESTAADLGSLLRPQPPLPEISLIAPTIEPCTPARQGKAAVERKGSADEGSEKLKVFLRIRPLTQAEKDRGEEQGCVSMQGDETLLLKAPKDSHNMRNAERGVTQSMHKFSFTQICGSETGQQEFYDRTMREMVRDVLQGENRLLYTYGVTNSGKTYTIQGLGSEAGLLPRALVSVFLKLSGRLYPAMDLKPVLCQEVRRLDTNEVKVESIRKAALLNEDDCSTSRLRKDASMSYDSGIGGLSTTSHIATQLEDSDSVCLDADGLGLSRGEELEEGMQISVWVSFYEIYNEFIYDLLDTPPSMYHRKRATLRLSDDKHGNPYVKDLTWIQVQSADEAWKVLKAGRRNQSFASTHLNHNSSRSHSIFTIRLLHIQPDSDFKQGTRISDLSMCDLAGSERCKDQKNGDRMKEANNINTSLHTLGRCMTALRYNQNNRSRAPQVVPFRDSKLTRVLQNFFTGLGRSIMVVNINPCASTYDETLQALKFSAIATQLVHGPSTKTRVAYILSLLREQQDGGAANESSLLEDDDSDNEGDITMLDSDALLQAIEVLKREVLRQRQEKAELEASVREEVCAEMMEVISRMQSDFSETLETEQTMIEERYEKKIGNLHTSLKKYYSQEIEERDEQIRELTAALDKRSSRPGSTAVVAAAPIFPPLVADEEASVRRSQRLAANRDTHTHVELEQCRLELDQCRAELDLCRTELRLKTLELQRAHVQNPTPGNSTTASTADRKLEEGQKNLRQLRDDLQKLVAELQSGERACCRNTDGERLRQALSSADEKLNKQDQMLVELHTSLQLVKAELRRKAECMPPPAPPTPGSSCKKRGCAAAAAAMAMENVAPPEKRPFFRSLFPSRTPVTRHRADAVDNNATPYARVLRSRQPSPPPSPSPMRRGMKY